MTPLQVYEVVASRVEHDGDPRVRGDVGERPEIGECEGIDEPGVSGDVGDLDEGEPLRIVVETVALGIQRYLGTVAESLHELGEVSRGANPARREASPTDV
jgi:hypothetical protein